MDLQHLTETALLAAKCVNRRAEERRQQLQVDFKQVRSGLNPLSRVSQSVVTDMDIEAQEIILNTFLDNGYGYLEVVAEEETYSLSRFAAHASTRIYIDPIDGTRTYLWGNEHAKQAVKNKFGDELYQLIDKHTNPSNYGIVIGIEDKASGFLLGICSLPARGVTYHALKGRGAFRNNEPYKAEPNNLPRTQNLLILQSAFYGNVSLFTDAGYNFHFSNSAPGNLHELFEENHLAFVGKKNDYPWLIHALVGKEAGLTALEKSGNEMEITTFDASHPNGSGNYVLAKNKGIADGLCAILRAL